MKLASVILLLVLIVSTLCIQSGSGIKLARKNQLEKLKNKGTWASIMVNMAELHLQMGNPLSELIESIEAVATDLDAKAERATEEYKKRTDFHSLEVTRINALIDSANSDIVSTGEFIANVLEPQVINLNNSLQSLEKQVSTTRQFVSDETARREVNHEKYLVVIEETDEAIQVISEALEVLSELSQPGTNTQLLQVRQKMGSLKKHFKYMNDKKFLKSADKALFVTLQTLVFDSQFADKDAVHKVEQLIINVRSNLMTSKEKATQEEEEEAATFVTNMEKAKAELVSMTNEITETNEMIDQTEQTIVDNQEFIEDRKRDLASAEQNLQQENDSFEAATQAYDDLIAQIEIEQSAVHQAVSYLRDASIEDYIGDRMESDVIIDQPHGAQIKVEEKFDEFQDQ